MQLALNFKNNILFVGSIAVSGLAIFLLTQLVFADSTTILAPTSDGAYKQWTRVASGSTHYTAVDETVCNGTTDYVHQGTNGKRESFAVDLSSVPNDAVVTNVAIVPCASRNNATGGGSSVLDVFYKWDSATSSADAGNYNLTGTTPVELATTSFSGLSFTKTASSTLEIGAVFSSGNRGARVSQLATVLTYDVPLLAPSNLTATASSTDAILNWTDNTTNENGFKIERHSATTTIFSEIALVGANVISYTDRGLASSTYIYRVRAFNAATSSAYSNIASTTIW